MDIYKRNRKILEDHEILCYSLTAHLHVLVIKSNSKVDKTLYQFIHIYGPEILHVLRLLKLVHHPRLFLS